jgi:hypothetical protein
LLGGDEYAGLIQEDGEDLEGAILNFEADAGFAEFAGEQIGFVRTKADERGKLGGSGHEVSCGYRRNSSTKSLFGAVSIAVEKDR